MCFIVTDSVSYQYNLKVVPTEVRMRSASVMTYQYGVQATERALNHSTGSHGVPGIFVKVRPPSSTKSSANELNMVAVLNVA